MKTINIIITTLSFIILSCNNNKTEAIAYSTIITQEKTFIINEITHLDELLDNNSSTSLKEKYLKTFSNIEASKNKVNKLGEFNGDKLVIEGFNNFYSKIEILLEQDYVKLIEILGYNEEDISSEQLSIYDSIESLKEEKLYDALTEFYQIQKEFSIKYKFYSEDLKL